VTPVGSLAFDHDRGTTPGVIARKVKVRPAGSGDPQRRNMKGGMLDCCAPKVSDPDDEFEGTEAIARRMRIILPNGPRKQSWDNWILLLVLYNAVAIPFEFGFGYEVAKTPAGGSTFGLFLFDVLVDLCFITDLIINFQTAYYEMDGKLELNRKKIRDHYFRNWFLLDLVASIPVDWFIPDGGSDTAALGAAKVPRLLRLGRLLKKFDQFAAARALRVLHLLFFFLMLAHWVACVFWKVGLGSGRAGWQFQPNVVVVLVSDSTLDVQDDAMISLDNHTRLYEIYEDSVGLGKRYLTSFYWALSMVMKSPWLPPTGGGEQFYSCCTLVLGTMAFATFVGTLTALITSIDKQNATYRDQVTALMEFTKGHGMSSSARKMLLSYWGEYFASTGGLDERDILAKIPNHVRPKLLMDLYKDLLNDCQWMQELSSMGCASFLYHLKPEVCAKGDRLLIAGTTSELMYILKQGELQVSFPETAGEMKMKEVLGEKAAEAMMAKTRRSSTRVPQGRVERAGSLVGFQPPFGPAQPLQYTVRAYSRSTFFSITRQAMAEVIRLHPNDALIFMRAMQHADKTLNPESRRRASQQLEADNTVAGEQGSPNRKSTRKSTTTLDLNDKMQRIIVTKEAEETGWLPDPDSEESKKGTASSAWMEAREDAEREIYAKIDEVSAKMDALTDVLTAIKAKVGA